MNAQSEVPAGTPLRDSWEQYKLTEEYQTSLRWIATNPVGELWAAFVKGWRGALLSGVELEQLRAERDEIQAKYDEIEARCYDGVPTHSSIFDEFAAAMKLLERFVEWEADPERGQSVSADLHALWTIIDDVKKKLPLSKSVGS